MKNILFDIETNGLLDELDVVHSLVILDIDTGKMVSCADHQDYTPITDGLELLTKAERLGRSQYTSIRLTSITKSVWLHLPW